MKATAIARSIAPSALAALFVAASLAGLRAEPEATSALHDALRPEHRTALETSEADLKAQLDTLAASETDAETAKAIADIRDLLTRPRQEIADEKSLIGNWRVRSLQVSDLGAYAYPNVGLTAVWDSHGLCLPFRANVRPAGSRGCPGIHLSGLADPCDNTRCEPSQFPER